MNYFHHCFCYYNKLIHDSSCRKCSRRSIQNTPMDIQSYLSSWSFGTFHVVGIAVQDNNVSCLLLSVNDWKSNVPHKWEELTPCKRAVIDRWLCHRPQTTTTVRHTHNKQSLLLFATFPVHNQSDIQDHPMKKDRLDCGLHQWACSSGTCILNIYVCDGVADCLDQSDEATCHHVCSEHVGCLVRCLPPKCVCHPTYVHINNRCVPLYNIYALYNTERLDRYVKLV